MNILYVIPARGGSKGIPGKNIRLLNGKPLICYSIDVARELTQDMNICVSTEDERIKKVVEDYGLMVPFKRPAYLATDKAATNDVLLHAINFYEKKGKAYDVIVLLQPTSPFRKAIHIKKALSLYNDNTDMVVSVKNSKSIPILCSENENGFLELMFNQKNLPRQEVPSFYEYSGSIYVINVDKLKKEGMVGFEKKRKFLMDDFYSIDIDSAIDWKFAEFLLKEEIFK